MNKTIKNALAVFAFTLILTLTAFSNNPEPPPIDPESPVIIYPEDVVAFTYTDSWWEVTPNADAKGYFADEDDNPLPGYKDGMLTFSGIVSTDYSPWAAAMCHWNQNMQLVDLSIEQLIQLTGWSTWGGTTFGYWDFASGQDFGAIRFQAEVSLSSCVEMPQQIILTQPTVVIIDGVSGTSVQEYDWSASFFVPKAYYVYKHTSSHPHISCPAWCAPIIPETLRYIGPYPGHTIAVKLPFNRNGTCYGAWVMYETTAFACYNSFNPF